MRGDIPLFSHYAFMAQGQLYLLTLKRIDHLGALDTAGRILKCMLIG
jgi:hypothetical protein